MRKMSYYVRRREEKEHEPGAPTFRTGIEPDGTRLKGWNRYPGLSDLPDNIRWTLESYDLDDAKLALQGIPAVPETETPADPTRLLNGSFAFVRPTGVGLVSMWRKNDDGSETLLGQDEALKLAHLAIDKWDSKGQKRIPRYLRPSYAFGVFDKRDFPTYTFEGKDSDWDAMMLMTRDAFNLITAHLPEEVQKRYDQQGRFEITMQGKEGQWKGHVRVVNNISKILPDAPKGTAMAIQRTPKGDSWKHETHGVYDDPNSLFFDVRPKKFHTGIDIDVQSWTNLGRYVLPNKIYQDWTRQKNDEFIAKIQRGPSPEDAQKLIFAGVDSDDQLESRLGMALYDYVASGGDIRNSPHMMREFGQMYLKGLQKDFGGNRLFIPDSFSGYMTSAATYGKDVLENPDESKRLRPGEVFLDPRGGSIVYHPDDTPQVLKAAGGADYDDRQAGFVFKQGDQYKVLMWRSPNEPGEYALFNLKNPSILEKLGIKPIEGVDISGLEKIPNINEKVYGKTEAKAQERPPAGSYPEFLRDVATRIDKYALGSYLKTVRMETGVLGRGSKFLAFTTEYVTDILQKFMEDPTEIKDEASRIGGNLARYPMPYSYWAGIRGRIPFQQRKLGYIPMPQTHQVAEMDEWMRQEFERVNSAVEGMANIATHPAELVNLAYPGGVADKELKKRATGAYEGVLTELRKLPEGGFRKNDSKDYEIAGEALQEHLLSLFVEERDQTLAQLLVSSETFKYGEMMLDDSLAWKKGKNFNIGDMTMDFLRRQGLLNEQPDMNAELIGMDHPPTTSAALNLIVKPAKDNIDPHNLLGLNISLEQEIGPYITDPRQLVVASRTLPDGTPWQGVMGTTVASQAMLQGAEGSVLSAVAKDRQIILNMARQGMQVAEPKAKYTVGSPNETQAREGAILTDLKVSAEKYIAGELDLAGMSPEGAYAVQAAAAQIQGRPAPRRNHLRRMYYDPDARDTTPRVLGSREMPWILELDKFNFKNEKKKSYSGRDELEAKGIENAMDAVATGDRVMHTSYGEDARQALFMRPGDYALVYNKHSKDRAALVQISGGDPERIKQLWQQQGLEWRGEAAYPMSGRQLEEKKEKWSELSGWKAYFASFYHRISSGIELTADGRKKGNIGWQEELGLQEDPKTADLSWNVNFKLVEMIQGRNSDQKEKAQMRIMGLLAGRLKVEAPPSGYFSLPFTPQHLDASDVDTYAEGGQTFYRPRRPDDWTDAEYNDWLRMNARASAGAMFDANPAEQAGWRGEFARWHFGGGRNNIDSFQAWHDQLDPQSMYEFESSYLGMYGEYLTHKSEGWNFNQLSNTVWAQYWNRFSQKYNLGAWPNTFMQKMFGMRWLDMNGAGAGTPPPGAPPVGAPPPGPTPGTNRVAEEAAQYTAPLPPAGAPPMPEEPPFDFGAPPDDYYDNYPGEIPGTAGGFTPPPPEPPDGWGANDNPPIGEEPQPEPQQEYPWRAVFGWKPPVPDDHPFKEIFDRQEANKQRLVSAIKAGKNVGVFMPTGTGKTEFIKSMPAELGGINILLTPLSSLNEQQADRLIKETTPRDKVTGEPVGPNLHQAFYLPGEPGYGHDDTKYKAQQAAAMAAIAEGFLKDDNGEFVTDEYGNYVWNEASRPITLVMSPEKFVNLGAGGRLGRAIQGHVRSVTIDEAQEFAKHVGREQMAQVKGGIEWVKGNRENMPVLLTGGTVSNYQEQALTEEYGLDTVIREYTDLPHINFRLNIVGSTNDYADAAADFAERADSAGRKALVYGYSTKEVERISNEINNRGMRSLFFHKGKGLRGRPMSDAELAEVQRQFSTGRLEQHLTSSSAGGMGIDLEGLRDVANVGPAEISDLVQRAGRIRPGKKGPDGKYGGTFELIATPWQFRSWGNSILKDTSDLATSPSLISQAFDHIKGMDFSQGWKEESDEIAKAIGQFLKARGVSENRGADVASVLRQVGAISMTRRRMDDGKEHMIAEFNELDDLLGTITSAHYTNEYRPHEELTYAQYWDTIGKRKSGEFYAVEKLLTRLAPLAKVDPEEAGYFFKRGLLSAYSARPQAQAPKPGHEGLAIKVQSGQGEEFRVYENIFTGPESGEISITTYADAFSKALRSGGSISGSWHSQPVGRSAEASEADRSGIGTLGRMEIQEGDFVGRMRASAPLGHDQQAGPAPQPQPQPQPQQPPQRPSGPLPYEAESVNAFTEHKLPQELMAAALEKLTKAARSAATEIEKQTDTTKRLNEEQAKRTEIGKMAGQLAGVYGLNMNDLGRAMGRTAEGLQASEPGMARILGLGGRITTAGARLYERMEAEESGMAAVEAYRTAGHGYQRNGPQGPSRGMIRLSGVLGAMRSWRMISDPVLQDAFSGTTDYLPIAAANGAPESYGNTVSGFRTRAQMVQEWQGRGAYQAFGGLLDLQYALSGSGEGAARAAAGTRVAFGLATSGSEIGYQMYQNAYFMPKGAPGKEEMEALGQKIWKGSMQAGMVLGVGSLVQEGVQPFAPSLVGTMFGTNLGNVPQEGWASQFARGVVGGFADFATIAAIGRDGGVGLLPTMGAGIAAFLAETAGGIVPGMGPSMRKMVQQKTGLTRDVYKKYGMTDEWADYLSYGGDSDNVKKYMENAKDLQRVLGGTADQHIGTIARSVASLGITSDQSVTLLGGASRLGISGDQWLSAIEGLGQQFGYRPGTAGMANFAMGMQGLDMAGLGAMQSQAGRISQFAGSLAPYIGYEAAAGLVQRYGINSPAQTSASQQTLALADRYGINTSAVTGQVGTSEFEKVKKTEKKLVGYQWVDEKGEAFDFLSDPNPMPVTKDQAFGFLKKQEEPAPDTRSKTGRWEAVYQDVTSEVDGAEIMRNKTYGEDLAANAAAWQQKKGSAYVEHILGQTGTFMDAGLDKSEYEPLFDSLSSYFSNLTPQQMSLAGRALGGEMGAQSYLAWNAPQVLQQTGISADAAKWNDQYGRPIYQTSGADWMRLGMAQYKNGLAQDSRFGMVAQSVEYAMAGPNTNTAMMYLGTSNEGLANAFLNYQGVGGMTGMQWYMQDQQWGFQQRSMAMAQQQLTGSIAYTRQMWGYEDQMNQLQYRSQMADFGAQRQRMQLTHSFDLQQDSLTWERMTKGSEYNRWNLQFNQQTSLMQRGWAREDYQYQDTMRGLQFGWNMEDMNEAIRFSTGRERRKLIRQRDRAATTHNLEEEQVDTQRERQEQVWAREDERYKKLMEYTEDMIKLDIRSFELNKSQRDQLYEMDRENLERHIKEYQEQFDLQREMEQAQRQYQEIQWDFQQRQLDLQKEQAELQREYEIATRNYMEDVDKVVGAYKQVAEYNPAKLMEPLINMMVTMGAMDKTNAEKIVAVINAIGAIDSTKIAALVNALEAD